MDGKVSTSRKSLQATLAPLTTNDLANEQIAMQAADMARGVADSNFANARAAENNARSAAAAAADQSRREQSRAAAATRNAKGNS